jgi:hypothetical protein
VGIPASAPTRVLLGRLRLNRYLTPSLHCRQGIDSQIDHKLVQLSRVSYQTIKKTFD